MGCSNSNVIEGIPTIKNNENIRIYSPNDKGSLELKYSEEMKDQFVNKNFKKQIISLNPNNNILEKKKEDYNISISPNFPIDLNKPNNNKLKKKLRCSQSVDKNACIKKLDINLEKKEEDDEDDSSYRGFNDSSYYAEETPRKKIIPKDNKKDNNNISSNNSSELSSDSKENKE